MTPTKSLTDFDKIINQDNTFCLYCKGNCKYTESSIDQSNFQSVELYYCEHCNERFVYYKFTISNTILYFTFSCRLIEVTVYSEHIFINNIKCPLVDFDFSNKDKLYSKLKTYMLFSWFHNFLYFRVLDTSALNEHIIRNPPFGGN